MRVLGFVFQFPWLIRYVPLVRMLMNQKQKRFHETTDWFLTAGNEGIDHSMMLGWLMPLVRLLQVEVDDSVQQVLDLKLWPKFSSIVTVPRRILFAFPLKVPTLEKDPDWAIRGYAIRFAFAFTAATVVEILMHKDASAHWFPMTVAFIMGPSGASTYEKVAHRTIGTLCGVALGIALSPVFAYPGVLILLLGLNTYGVCIFFTSNYAAFTIFITSWVFCTTVGVGAPTGVTVFYRCMWTLAAAFTVALVTYTYPPRNQSQLTKLLFDFAGAVQDFTEAVVAKHDHLVTSNEADGSMCVEQASQRVTDAKQQAIATRLALFNFIHDAVLTPTGGCRINPHTVAPQIASDLIDASVIPLFLTLVDSECECFWSDLEDRSELNRLVNRLETEAKDCSTAVPSAAASQGIGSPTGPFSSAIRAAHKRLDEVGVPSDIS
jgi:Fusaric acid resistance protein-like